MPNASWADEKKLLSLGLRRYRFNVTWHKFPKGNGFSFFVDFIQLSERTKHLFLTLTMYALVQKVCTSHFVIEINHAIKWDDSLVWQDTTTPNRVKSMAEQKAAFAKSHIRTPSAVKREMKSVADLCLVCSQCSPPCLSLLNEEISTVSSLTPYTELLISVDDFISVSEPSLSHYSRHKHRLFIGINNWINCCSTLWSPRVLYVFETLIMYTSFGFISFIQSFGLFQNWLT